MKWKDVSIKPFNERYQVSDKGQVKNKQTGRLLKQQFNKKTGYMQVTLTLPSEKKLCNVHRLVLNAFDPAVDKSLQVNHIDECKTNNCLANLEWTTRKQNINYGEHTKKQINTLLFKKPEKKAVGVIVTRDDNAKVMVSSIRQASKWTKISQNKINEYMNSNCFVQSIHYKYKFELAKPKQE